jgi:hypothetical protein
MKSMKLLGGDKCYKIYHDTSTNQYVLQYNLEIPISKDYIDSLSKESIGKYIIVELKSNFRGMFSYLLDSSMIKFYDTIKKYVVKDLIQEINKDITKIYEESGDNFVEIMPKSAIVDLSTNVIEQVDTYDAYSSLEDIEKKFIQEKEQDNTEMPWHFDDFTNLNAIDARYKMMEDFDK